MYTISEILSLSSVESKEPQYARANGSPAVLIIIIIRRRRNISCKFPNFGRGKFKCKSSPWRLSTIVPNLVEISEKVRKFIKKNKQTKVLLHRSNRFHF
jgi:hypothetical protein